MGIQEAIVEKKRADLVSIATAMLDGRLHLIEGARKICALRHAVGQPEHPVFMPIRAIESETDHFPIGDVREHSAADYLARMDDEMNRYLADARQDILNTCREIIRVFS